MTVDTKIQNQYKVSLDWDDNFDSVTVHAGVRSPLMIGPPPEFNGKESIWSPEHLLISSLSSCYTTTFMHFAKLLKAPIRKFHVEASVEFEREGLLAKAEKYCIISKSVKGEVIIEASVRLN